MSQTLQSQLAAALVAVEIQIKSELDKALEALEAAKARVKAERENEKLVQAQRSEALKQIRKIMRSNKLSVQDVA